MTPLVVNDSYAPACNIAIQLRNDTGLRLPEGISPTGQTTTVWHSFALVPVYRGSSATQHLQLFRLSLSVSRPNLNQPPKRSQGFRPDSGPLMME